MALLKDYWRKIVSIVIIALLYGLAWFMGYYQGQIDALEGNIYFAEITMGGSIYGIEMPTLTLYLPTK